MIASLEGKMAFLGADYALINVGGIGFQVYMPTSTLSQLGTIGEPVRVHTHLHVREDKITLYGFNSAAELWLFETLLGVSGLGPRLALAMLSAMNAEQLTTALATGNADMLTVIPGIGKKLSHRMVLELKDKIGAGWLVTPATQLARAHTDVLAALTSLGYSAAEATRAVATLPADENLSIEEKIRLALQYFGG